MLRKPQKVKHLKCGQTDRTFRNLRLFSLCLILLHISYSVSRSAIHRKVCAPLTITPILYVVLLQTFITKLEMFLYTLTVSIYWN